MDEPEFLECGSVEGDEIWRVVKPYYAIIRSGPPAIIPVGSTIRLRADSAKENFSAGRIAPVDLQGPAKYEVIEKFQTVDLEGYWEHLNVGDKVELTLEEALPLLRKFKIKRVEGGEKE